MYNNKISQNIKSLKKEGLLKGKQHGHERQNHWLQTTAQPVNREKKGGRKGRRIRDHPSSHRAAWPTTATVMPKSAKRRYRPNRMDEKTEMRNKQGCN